MWVQNIIGVLIANPQPTRYFGGRKPFAGQRPNVLRNAHAVRSNLARTRGIDAKASEKACALASSSVSGSTIVNQR